MAGIEVSEEITNDQLEAMSGGELLRAEVRWIMHEHNKAVPVPGLAIEVIIPPHSLSLFHIYFFIGL